MKGLYWRSFLKKFFYLTGLLLLITSSSTLYSGGDPEPGDSDYGGGSESGERHAYIAGLRL